MKWKLIKEEDVSPSKWFSVFKHEVELPDGKRIDDYYVAKLSDAAMVLPITKDGKLIFVRQYKHGARDILVEFPAGFLEKDETPQEAAIRELKEEIGVSFEMEDLISLGNIYSLPTKLEFTVYGFIANGVEIGGEQNLDENENIEIVTKTLAEVREMVISGELNTTDTLAFLSIANLKYPELFDQIGDDLKFKEKIEVDKD